MTDDDDAKRVLEATPTAQLPNDAFPELPLGVEAFRSPLHTLPASPPAHEDSAYARRAYIVVSTLAICVGVFAALATREPSPQLSEAPEDRTSSLREVRAIESPELRRGAVRPALASVNATSLEPAAPNPFERSSVRRTPSRTAATAKAPLRDKADKPKNLQRSAAGRARVKSAARTRPQLPTRNAVLAAMRRVTRDARSCLSGNAVAQVDITFSGETGNVDAASVHGVDGAAADCVARAIRSAKLQPFAKPRLDITFPFRAKK